MPAGLTGNTHRDTMNIRHNEYRKEAIEKIEGLRGRFEKMNKEDIGTHLDTILKELHYQVS